MIIRLISPLFYLNKLKPQKVVIGSKAPLSYKEKIRLDRIATAIFAVSAIIGLVILTIISHR